MCVDHGKQNLDNKQNARNFSARRPRRRGVPDTALNTEPSTSNDV